MLGRGDAPERKNLMAELTSDLRTKGDILLGGTGDLLWRHFVDLFVLTLGRSFWFVVGYLGKVRDGV